MAAVVALVEKEQTDGHAITIILSWLSIVAELKKIGLLNLEGQFFSITLGTIC